MSSLPTSHAVRDYASLLDRFDPEPRLLPPHLRDERMLLVVDALWEQLSGRGVSWIGFYLKDPQRDEMVLGARRDRPACSPIGLYGVCGRSWFERRPIVVSDVAMLGKSYIACDPRDRSEAVIPLLEADGTVYAVLDADSYERGSFDTSDVIGLTTLVEHAGLSARPPAPLPIIRV